MDRLPEVGNAAGPRHVDIDQARMPLGAVADEAGPIARQIDRQGDAAGDVRLLGRNQFFAAIEFDQRQIAAGGRAVAEPHLAEPRALTHHHRKRLRANLGIKRSAIAGGDLIEGGNAIGNDPGEDIEATGGAFRVGCRR
jgi:hypothetical protein